MLTSCIFYSWQIAKMKFIEPKIIILGRKIIASNAATKHTLNRSGTFS
jgi:hypothetical protein